MVKVGTTLIALFTARVDELVVFYMPVIQRNGHRLCDDRFFLLGSSLCTKLPKVPLSQYLLPHYWARFSTMVPHFFKPDISLAWNVIVSGKS